MHSTQYGHHQQQQQQYSESGSQGTPTAPPRSPMSLDPNGSNIADIYSAIQHDRSFPNYWTASPLHQQPPPQTPQEPPNGFGEILNTTSAYTSNANFSVPSPFQQNAHHHYLRQYSSTAMTTTANPTDGIKVVTSAPLTMIDSISDEIVRRSLEELDYKICRIDSLPHFFQKTVRPLASEHHYAMVYRWKETANVSYKMHLELMAKLPGITDIETGYDRKLECSYFEFTVHADPRYRRSFPSGETDRERTFERLFEFKDDRTKTTTFAEENVDEGKIEIRIHPRDEIDQKILSLLEEKNLGSDVPPVMQRDLARSLREILKTNENKRKIKNLSGIKKKSSHPSSL